MKINMDRLFDYMMEADNETARYYQLTNDYKKKHGCIPFIDIKSGLRTNELVDIEHASQAERRCNDVVDALVEVAGFDRDQQSRLMSAYTAVKRWYEKETKWQRCLPDDLIERLTAFIVGASA